MRSIDEKKVAGNFYGARLQDVVQNFGVFLLLSGLLIPVAAFAQAGNGSTLNSAVAPGNTVTLSGPGFIFGHDEIAVSVTHPTILRGNVTNNFPVSIFNLSGDLLSNVNAKKTDTTSVLSGLVQGWVDAFNLPTNLTYIAGDGGTRTKTVDYFDQSKWLNISIGSTLSLEYLHFKNVTVDNNLSSEKHGVVNGLIGSASSNTKDISMGNLTGNAFTGINVILRGKEDTDYLAGGGVVGLRATGELDAASASASMGNITGNVFKGVSVLTTDYNNDADESAYIEGGGVIGVDAVSTPNQKSGHASIDLLDSNLFTGIKVQSDDIILGGGVVGVNNNSRNYNADTYAKIISVSNNVFGNGTDDNINVSSKFSLRGGGVIGINGLSNAAVALDVLSNNVFAGIRVTSTDSYLKGGGIVGLQGNDGGDDKEGLDPGFEISANVQTYLDSASGNLFLNAEVGVNTYLEGGGIIGLRANKGAASLNGLSGNVFKGLKVTLGTVPDQHLSGGGIVGLSSKTWANLTMAENNYFDDLEVKVTAGSLTGGGIIGVDAENQENSGTNSVIGFVTNNTFTNLSTKVGGSITGGGIVGARATAGIAAAIGITKNRFEKVTVETTSESNGNIIGGGIVGVDAGNGNALITDVADNQFIEPTVTADGYIFGGGVLGVRSDSGLAYIGEISRNVFQGAKITAGTYINGGGLIGMTGDEVMTEEDNDSAQVTGIQLLEKSVFTGNTVTAQNGQIMGGAIYSYGSFIPMTISDSSFTDNTFTSTISDNTVYKDDTSPGAKVYGTVTVDTGLASPVDSGYANTLILTATDGNSTVFRNNQIKEGDGDLRTNSLYFGKVMNMVTEVNEITATDSPALSDAHLIVAPQSGGTVALYDPIEVDQDNASDDRKFDMTVRGAGEFLWGGKNKFAVGGDYSGDYAANNKVDFESGSTTTLLNGMELDAPAHDVNLAAGGRINVMGANKLIVKSATLNGHLHFNLDAATVDDVGTALLTIAGTEDAHINGATVSLSNFAAGAPLKAGDEFYLIETDGANDLDDDPANNSAYARQGMMRAYNFTVDKESQDSTTSQRLVARLLDAPIPAKEARIVAEGRIAGLAILGQNANWLADHSYQQADLALRRGENRAFFGGADFASVRIDTGASVDYTGYTVVAGEAVKREKDDQSLLIGGFFEGGYGEYDVHGKFGHPDHPNMKGNGTLHYYGIGLMARQRWDKGFRLEASLRGGRQENKFRSRDLTDVDGEIAKYKLNVPWFGAHLGAGYEWQADEHNGFDTFLRYYWVRQNGKTVHLNKDRERVRFLNDNSHRLRVGGRYTRTKDVHQAWYLGLAYEYEFDHRAHARTADGKIDVPDPRGNSFVGEIGMVLHPKDHDRFSIEFGLQGYAGKREGVSGGARLGWKF
ncbi:MAG: autotransporter outer membrane beta-barrel domain-containing protein [Azoarcus sp.]|jgi:hypothetical protein|nr:autotransporter outer membrane beta-barrel domain-containing protein [Azoarcus sp.]